MKQRVLATDPDTIMLDLYRDYFRILDFEVAIAADGIKCIESLRRFCPNVLILNYELIWGGADGVLSILQEEFPATIPVILTAEARHRSKAKSLQRSPVVELLLKPFRFRHLEDVIATSLGMPIGRSPRRTDFNRIYEPKDHDRASLAETRHLPRRPPYFPLSE